MTDDDPPMPLQRTLPRHCYLDEAFFNRESESIFATQWFCVARASHFRNVGDYQVVRVGRESVLVVKSEASVLQAFHNVCRHRGSQLVFHDDTQTIAGCFKANIRCPYHSWTYALNGELLITPHLDNKSMTNPAHIDKKTLGLHGIELETWAGFVFLRLKASQDAKPLGNSIKAIDDRLQRYPLAELQVGKRIDYRVKANWKVVLENYNECYHCAGVHPELCKVVPAFRQNGGADLDWERGVPHRKGANTFTFSGSTNRRPFAGLNDDEKSRHKGELVYPNLLLSLAMDHVAAFTLMPRGAGHTDIVCEFLFHPEEIAQDNFNSDDAVEFWDLTNQQDWRICESVQRGMNSMMFDYGYYAPMEDWSLDIRDYILRHIPDVSDARPIDLIP